MRHRADNGQIYDTTVVLRFPAVVDSGSLARRKNGRDPLRSNNLPAPEHPMAPTIVTASTLVELSLLVQATGAVPCAEAAPLQGFRGRVGDRELLFVITGIGKVNAASATTLLLERFRPRLLINTGCAGAFASSGLAVGDVAVATSETFADEGVETPAGWRSLDLIGIPVFEGRGARIFNTVPLPPGLA